MRYDVGIIGTGAMGGSAAWHLARAGASVIALDRFQVPHDRGSSHAETRLIRQAYFEDPGYVPILRRAYALWDELTELCGNNQTLFVKNGLFIAGKRERAVMQGVLKSAAEHGIPIEQLTGPQARDHFPGFSFEDDDLCIFEPGAGYLNVDAVLNAQLSAARKFGAMIQQNTVVSRIIRETGGFRLETDKDTFEVKKVVVAAGAWGGGLFPDLLGSRLVPHRVPLFWFQPKANAVHPKVCFAFDLAEGFFYGFPPLGSHGVKAGLHKPGPKIVDPTSFDRVVGDAERKPVRDFIRSRISFAKASEGKDATCIYTMTTDENFIIDSIDDITILAGFSGHGFKFASVVGEIAKDLVLTGRTVMPIDFLRLNR